MRFQINANCNSIIIMIYYHSTCPFFKVFQEEKKIDGDKEKHRKRER